MKTRVPDRITSHTRELGRLISTDRRQFGVECPLSSPIGHNPAAHFPDRGAETTFVFPTHRPFYLDQPAILHTPDDIQATVLGLQGSENPCLSQIALQAKFRHSPTAP